MSRSLRSYTDAERPYVIARRLKSKKEGLGKLAAADAPKLKAPAKAEPDAEAAS